MKTPARTEGREATRTGSGLLARIVNGLQPVTQCPPGEWRKLLATAGLTPEDVAIEGATVPFHKGIAAFEAAATWSDNPHLCIDYAKAFAVGVTGPLGFALVSAGSVREALKTICRFVPLAISVRYCRFEEDASAGSVVWQHPSTGAAPRLQFVAWEAAVGMRRIADAMRDDWKPLAVVLDVEPPREAAALQAYFGPRLRFERGPNRFSIESRFLDAPMPAADPRLFAMMTRLSEIEQKQRSAYASDFEGQARAELTKLLRLGQCTAADLAEALGHSPAQLRAALKRHDLDFRSLIDDVRRERAHTWLMETGLTITAIAFNLGYSDSSVFTRACHKWFGRAPSEVRSGASR